MRGDGWHGAE
eukprot:symbB.v1.2.034922.t1/scaffold4596.1/size37583/1